MIIPFDVEERIGLEQDGNLLTRILNRSYNCMYTQNSSFSRAGLGNEQLLRLIKKEEELLYNPFYLKLADYLLTPLVSATLPIWTIKSLISHRTNRTVQTLFSPFTSRTGFWHTLP